MRKMTGGMCLVFVVLFTAGCAQKEVVKPEDTPDENAQVTEMHAGHEGMHATEQSAEPEGEFTYCPVMGTRMQKSKAFDSVEYKGKMYYFCCAGCKPMFMKDPEKYINK